MVITHTYANLSIDSLNKKYGTRNEFDKTIGETENAFIKVCLKYNINVFIDIRVLLDSVARVEERRSLP